MPRLTKLIREQLGWAIITPIVVYIAVAITGLEGGTVAKIDGWKTAWYTLLVCCGLGFIMFLAYLWIAANEIDSEQRATISKLQDRLRPRIEMEFDQTDPICATGNRFRIKLQGSALAKPWLIDVIPNDISSLNGAIPAPLNCDQDVNHVPLQLGGVPRYIEFLQWNRQKREGIEVLLITIQGTNYPFNFIFPEDKSYRFHIRVDDLEKNAPPYARWFELHTEGHEPHLMMLPEQVSGIPSFQTPAAS